MTVHDTLVIGAGLAGLTSASHYLTAHPSASVLLLESSTHVGGVFSAPRVHPHFYTQWTHGLSEYADMEMERPPEEDCIGDCYRAKWTVEYLEEYADKKIEVGGKDVGTLRERVRFGCRVVAVERRVEGEGWRVECIEAGTSVVYEARRVMVCAGEHSRPNIPSFPGSTTFAAPIIHSTDLGSSDVLSRPSVTNVVVVGAGKSSADILYAALKAGKAATWIIRASGSGPGFFVPLDIKAPGFRNPAEAAQVRLAGIMHPSILHADGFWVWLLHRTRLGRAFLTFVFGLVDREARKRANYHGRPEATTRGFDKLDYSPGVFWQNNAGGALHHADFWDLVAEKVMVYRADIAELRPKTVVLDDGTGVPCDALLLGTGWKPGLEMFSQELRKELGLPYDPRLDDEKTRAKWESMEQEGDAEVLNRFPMLASPPPHPHTPPTTTPFRLINGIAPLSADRARDIVFINYRIAGNMLFNAEVQAMWGVAYLDGNITLPALEKREREVATWTAYCRRRYLSAGGLASHAVFDLVAFADVLVGQMGGEGWPGGWMDVLGPKDLGRVWDGYLKNTKVE
ncbi:putative dimethylaniline monooxygenase [Massariosphaeria phaeospora]|uniref:Putative dimethylaniline monooxygenase n=1 Tax=Massariosphaeria phaeospora TaxID=100035 RepID=A0A7C8MS87_9PLEO|nr:putative dimethylaniline monooxygenase [Massariosphaeria phaeospora]